MAIRLVLILGLALADGCARPAGNEAKGRAATNEEHEPQSIAAGSASLPPTDTEVPIGEPNRESPVVVAAAIAPSRGQAGDVVLLAIRFRTAIGWHFFAVREDGGTGPIMPTKLTLNLPSGVSADGDWELPRPDVFDGPTGRSQGYEGDVTFRRRIRIASDQIPDSLAVSCRVEYQCCDNKTCLRPEPQTLRFTLEVVAR